jgi:serine phosphatase RsbU (regulator of sigma subunit)
MSLSLRRFVSPISLAVLAVLLAITVAGALAARAETRDQEIRLLHERTNEVGVALTSAISALPGPLDVLGGVLRATNESASAFGQASAAAEVGSASTATFALIQKTPAGFRVVMAKGGALHPGEIIRDQRAQAFQKALMSAQLVPTTVIGKGADRALGFALGPPVAPAGTVLYRQDTLGPIGAPREAKTAPFSELDVVIYADSRPDPSQVLAETTNHVPLTGMVRSEPLAAGAVTWTLQASAVHPLIGSTTAHAQWIVLGSGIVLAILVALVVEGESRRRKSAVELYDVEHRLAETLQRNLLPELPDIAGLGLAASYLPGAAHLEIGGDWFDVFGLDDGRVGLVIGDVLGHDIAAAAAMSKIQASLRAYAWGGAAPSVVLDRLDDLITTFEISELVTVFYGVLDPADESGSRQLTFSNAGHLPPFVRQPDAAVESLAGANSLLLGAPGPPGMARPQREVSLAAGSSLLLFTDGLVERPGESLTTSLAQLEQWIAASPAGSDAATLCDLVLAHVDAKQLRDDVAVLAVYLESSELSGQRSTPIEETAAVAGPAG